MHTCVFVYLRKYPNQARRDPVRPELPMCLASRLNYECRLLLLLLLPLLVGHRLADLQCQLGNSNSKQICDDSHRTWIVFWIVERLQLAI